MISFHNAERERGGDWLSSLQSLLGTVVIAVFVITFVVQASCLPTKLQAGSLHHNGRLHDLFLRGS